MMRYTAEYFRKDMPEWKKKKDPIFARFFYRPVSFYISAICANMGIKANVVTIFSVFVANFELSITALSMVNVNKPSFNV